MQEFLLAKVTIGYEKGLSSTNLLRGKLSNTLNYCQNAIKCYGNIQSIICIIFLR